MSKILSRPMFKRGGTTNTGIMDGFEDINTEDRVQASNGNFMGSVQSMIGPRPERLADPSRLDELFAGVREAQQYDPTFDQGLALARAGFNLASAPGGQPFLQTAAQVAQESLPDFEKIGDKRQKAKADIAATDLQLGLTKFEADQAQDASAQATYDKLLEVALDAELNPNDLVFYTREYSRLVDEQTQYEPGSEDYIRIQKDIDNLRAKYVGPIANKLAGNFLLAEQATAYAEGKIEEENAKRAAETPPRPALTEAEVNDLLPKLTGQYYAITAASSLSQADPTLDLAEGGRVEAQEGTFVAPTEQGQTPKGSMGLTFQELRARLPQEVSDSVVRLIATSEEALLDFANLETQDDIALFNQKYQSDLQLPSQVA
jgi:hypothetical protein